MKVKDIERTANVAWSPANQHPILLAAGTAAQQLDASFSTNAALEIYSLNLSEPGLDTELKISTPSEHRFHKIVWGAYGSGNSNGTIVGGCDGGIVQIYNVAKMLNGENGLVASQKKHNGPVHALDFNPFQLNLLATGAAESEIYIWDLNNTTTPMTPGAKSQPFEDVVGIAWNRQVQHILASTFASKCVVWDLRKNEPIIKLTDTVSRIRWKVVAWHPEIATQLCLASEEDHAPIIQLWDLRFATSPLKTLENHQRGVLSLAWCERDPDLLVSCGKDNRILCWDPNSNQPNGEVLSEIAKTNQWSFDVVWCPRNPALIACPNFDGHVTVYSLMGGKTTQVQTTKKIADSFPGMEGYMEAPVMQETVTSVSSDLSKPPKWLKRLVGASFGFGGKLITFENVKAQPQQTQPQQPGQQPVHQPRPVYISQVVTEEALVQKSKDLEQALQHGNYTEYCKNKAESLTNQHKRYIWYFLKAHFEENTRGELLNLLGYRAEDINGRLSQYTNNNDFNNDIDGLSDQLSNLNKYSYYDYDEETDRPLSVSPEIRWPSPFDTSVHDQNTQIPSSKKITSPFKIKTGDDTDGLITQALLLGNIEAAVELCFKAKRYADAIIIAMTGGPDLLAKTQYKYLEQSEGYVSFLISALVSEDWSSITTNCDVSSWKEALVAVLTHASNEDLPVLCEQLAKRLEEESKGDPNLIKDAQLCYICAGDFERLVASWSDTAKKTTEDLQELIELVTFLQKAVERQGRTVEISGNLANLLSNYALLLSSQGCLSTALNYLGTSQNQQVADLRDRLLTTLGHKSQQMGQRTRHDSRHSVSSYSGQPQYKNFNNTANQFPAANQFPSANQFSAANQFAPATKPAPVNYGQFNTGLPNATPNQPWQQQNQPLGPVPGNIPPSMPPPVPPVGVPPKTFSPAPPAGPTQPPRPGSVGSAHGDSGIRSRAKYVVDPSVASNNSYGSIASFAPNPISAAPAAPFNQSAFQTNAVASTNNSLYGQPPFYSSPTSNVQNPLVPPSISSPSIPAPLPAPAHNPIPSPSGYGIPPVTNQPGYQSMGGGAGDQLYGKPEVAQPAVSAMNSLPPTAAPGWNDPPAFQKSSRLQPKQSELPKQDPITHPLYGAVPAQQIPTGNSYPDQNQSLQYGQTPNTPPQMYQPGGMYNPQQQAVPAPYGQPQQQQPYNPQQPPLNPQPFNPAQPSFNPQAFNPSGFNPNPVNAPFGGAQQPQVAEVAPVKPEPVQKPPIPEEHQYMQNVFEELRNKCSCIASNPQTKRKLDDVSRKLEVLYDMLREQKLSPNTLDSLHEMVRLIEAGDYLTGLQLHTQLVSGPDFAQIAGFMPGLKVLLQCAIQLQVYLR